MGEDRDQSSFNMAVSYLNRLNILFMMADDAAMFSDSYGWFHALMAIRRELSTEMKPDELEHFSKEKTRLNELLAKNANQNARTGRGDIIPELYDGLDDFEMRLRDVLKAAGLQTKMMNDPRKAL